MKVVYTLAGNIYQPTDIDQSMMCAETAAQHLGKGVWIALESKTVYPVLQGVNGLNVKGNNFSFNAIQGPIVTRLQYKGANGEIVVVVCPTIQLLQKLQDSGISLMIVVPEMDANACPDIYHWLDLNSAMDIRTGAPLSGIGQPATGVMRAVGYLKDYSLRLGINLTHTPVYTGELADVANTLKKQGLIADYEEVVKYCLFRGLSFAEANIVAKAFSQKSLLSMRGKPDYNMYWQSINDPKWD